MHGFMMSLLVLVVTDCSPSLGRDKNGTTAAENRQSIIGRPENQARARTGKISPKMSGLCSSRRAGASRSVETNKDSCRGLRLPITIE
jgi:hypothetical protein